MAERCTWCSGLAEMWETKPPVWTNGRTPQISPLWRLSGVVWNSSEVIAVLTSEVGSNSGGATSNTVTTERYFDRYKLIKGGSYNTEVLVEKFFSPTYIPSMYATEPRPMPVYYNFLGMTQSILALHPEIEVPELTVELELVRGFGTKPIIQNWKLPSVFPKTNMLTWVTHPRFLEVTERDGGFYYTRGTVTPPEIPKTIEI